MTEWVHLKGCREEHPVPGICRGYNGKPIIVQPDGKKTLQYARASSCGDVLDDKGNLIAWSQANAVRGALADERLASRFRAVDDGWVMDDAKKAAKAILGEMAVLGGAETKANKGTLLHSWTEIMDRGEDTSQAPAEIQNDLTAYAWVTDGFEHQVIEEFCVVDDLRLAGTPDRISYVPDPDPDGVVGNKICDLKSGKIGFPNKMTTQLGAYSRAVRYHQYPDGAAVRSPFPEVSQRWGVIIHLPAGTGQASLHWLNIEEGWRSLTTLVPAVKNWRSRKDLLVPFA